MIKNVVFDIGNVLLSFKPKEYLEKKGYPEKLIDEILAEIFYGSEWLAIDNGDITTGEAIEQIAERTSLSKDVISEMFDSRADILSPLEQNVKLLSKFKQEGYKVYYLSNFSSDLFPEIKNSYSFFNLFDGGIISAVVRVSKPDEAIYRLLIDKYSLIANESLFIDDLEINVKAAEKVGMAGICTYGSEDIWQMLKDSHFCQVLNFSTNFTP